MPRKVSPQKALARLHANPLRLPKIEPGQAPTLRDELFELAGVTRERQAALLTQAVNKIEESLNSTTTQRLVCGIGLGKSEVREFIDIDHAERRKAAGEVIELLGAKPSRFSIHGASSVPVQVNIAFAPLRTTPQRIKATATVVDVPSK